MQRFVKIATLLAALFAILWITTRTSAQGQPSAVTIFPTSLHAGPARSSAVLFSVPAKTLLQIEARNAGADWLLVHTADMRQGWLLTRQLGFQNNPALNSLPISSLIIGITATSAPPSTVPVAKGANQSTVAKPTTLDAFLANPSSYAAKITPQIRASIRAIYRRGLALGNNPRVFAKVGNCWTSDYWAYQQFGDGQPYNLGAFSYLSAVIDYYSVSPRNGVANSFVNKSQVANGGLSADGVFNSVWADPGLCTPGESPLACEFRINHPSVMIAMLGVTDVYSFQPYYFNYYMQRMVSEAAQQGVVLILSTAPNPPSNYQKIRNQFNEITRNIARANNLPLIELSEAAENLPDYGVDPDGVHPSPFMQFTRVSFTPEGFRQGANLWDFLALQSLYNVWSTLGD